MLQNCLRKNEKCHFYLLWILKEMNEVVVTKAPSVGAICVYANCGKVEVAYRQLLPCYNILVSEHWYFYLIVLLLSCIFAFLWKKLCHPSQVTPAEVGNILLCLFTFSFGFFCLFITKPLTIFSTWMWSRQLSWETFFCVFLLSFTAFLPFDHKPPDNIVLPWCGHPSWGGQLPSRHNICDELGKPGQKIAQVHKACS